MIEMKTFYLFGSLLIGASVLGSAISAKIVWASLNIGNKISTTGNFFFQVLLFTLFFGLYIQARKQAKQMVVANSPEADEFMEELRRKDILRNKLSKATNEKVIKDNILLKGGIKK
jgi:hypothetical protein